MALLSVVMVTGPKAGPRAGRRRRRGSPVLRALLRQRRRLLLAGVAIALGVGYLTGALGLLDRIGAGLDELATASADEADLVLEGGVAYESSLEQVRRLVPSSLVDATSGISGVESSSHRLEDIAVIVDDEGQPVVTPGLSEQPLGVNWPEDPSISNLEFLDGAPPEEDSEVAIDQRSARAAGAGVGDQVVVAGKGKVGDYTVSGIVDTAAAGSSDGSSLVVLTTPEARLVFDRPIDDNRVALTLSEGADADAVAAQLMNVVPPGVEVVDNETAALHAQERLTRSFSLVRALVTGFGVLALAVGMLTVANSLSLLHSQRRHLFASFRLVGASVGQLRRAAFAEAGLLALVASVVGIPLGLLLAVLIERALGSLGTAVPTHGPPLSVRAVVVSVLVGVVATLVAAWRPVTSACRVPPVEAVRDVEPAPSRRWSTLSTSAARAAVFAVAAGGIALLADAEPAGVAIATAVTAVVVLVLGLLPWLLARLVALFMHVVPFRPRPLRRVAARDAARNPRRTAATTASVLLAAAVVSGLAVFLHSFTASVNDAVGELVAADLVVDSETFTRGGLPSDLVDQLGFVDGVEEVSGWQLGRGSVGEIGVRMTGLDGEAALDVVAPEFRDPAPDALGPRSVWISASLAERTGLAVGSYLPLLFTSGGFEDLEIAGVYETGQALLGDVVADREVLERQVPATVDLAALLRTDGSTATAAEVGELAASYGVTAVLTPSEFVDQRAELLRGFERVVQWMLLFTLLQALVGVVNTLMLSVGERRREFGLLRVSGASRRQVLRMVMFEGTALASVGTILGLTVGIAGAAAAVWALGPLGLGVFSVPVLTVMAIAAVALSIGVVAAWVPARMAARVPPLEAVVDSGVEFVGDHAVAEPTPVVAPVAAVPVASSGIPARTGPVIGVATAGRAPVPPPFDPARLATAVPAAAPDPAAAVLSVAVWDGGSVTALDPGSAETAALLALYGIVPAPSQPVVTTGPVSGATIEHGAAVTPAAPAFAGSGGEQEVARVLAQALLGAGTPAAQPVAAAPTPTEPVVQTAAAAPEPVAPPPAGPATTAPPPLVSPPVVPPPTESPLGPPPNPFEDARPDVVAAEIVPEIGTGAALETGGDVESSVEEAEVIETHPFATEPTSQTPAATGFTATPPTRPAAEPTESDGDGPGVMPPEGPTTPGVPGPVSQPEPRSEPGEPEAGGRPARRDRKGRGKPRIPRRRSRRSAPTSAAEGWVSATPEVTPPAPGTDRPDTPLAPEPVAAAAPLDADRHTEELSAALRNLDPESVLRCSVALNGMGGALAGGEHVGLVVCGRVKAWPAAVARTDRRLLLVVDRPGRLVVESLHPIATAIVVRPGVGGTVILVLLDQGRTLEITDVPDAAVAEAMVLKEQLTS